MSVDRLFCDRSQAVTFFETKMAQAKDQTKKKVTLDNEALFISAYNLTSFDDKKFKDACAHAKDRLKNLALIPESDVIHNCDLFSIPDFLDFTRERDAQLFFDATMAVGELLCFFLLLDDSLSQGDARNYMQFLDSFLQNDDDWISDTQRCKQFFNVIFAAASIVKRNHSEDYPVDNVKKYFDDKTIQFLTDVALVQKSLCQSRAFKAFIEVIGKLFIVNVICTNSQNQTFRSLEVVIYMINQEKMNSSTQNPTNEYQTYLNFVKTVNILYDDPQLPSLLVDTEILQKAGDFGFPSFFSSFVDFLTSMVQSPQLASYVYDYIKNTPSDILKFQNFLSAISEHTTDFMQCEIDRQNLDAKDTLGLESVLRLISALCKQDPKFVVLLTQSDQYKQYNLVNSLIMYPLSPVPASLKAECFNCLASMKINLWSQLKATKILTEEIIDSHKDGILSDINIVEAQAQYFSIPRALSNLIASMLTIEDATPDNFLIYHRFMNEEILKKLKVWKYLYPDIKWGMLRSICTAWINALSRKNWLDICMPIFRTAISDQSFINELLHLTNEETCPVECLEPTYKFLLLLLQKEKDFLKKALASNDPCAAAVVNQISRDPNAVIKILRCLLSHFKDFQITALKLIEFLATASPSIIQILLTKPSAKAIQICNGVINVNEPEDSLDLNVRCLLLDMLFKLGSNSYFVRHVCGFDQHDPPNSILHSTLDSGIFVLITKKLCEIETHKNYQNFVAKALRVLLLECKQELTIGSTLNLLRSSLHSFFISQLKYLTSHSSSRIAIGCFLQILAREASNSSQTGSLSGITYDSFNYLMTTQTELGESKRSVLILDFIDRVNDDNESKYILKGVNDLTVSYLNSASIIKMMKESSHIWPSTWIQIIFCLLEKLQKHTNSKLTGRIAGTCSIISNAVFIEKRFGEINSTTLKLKKLFTIILNSLIRLVEIDHVQPRISMYGLLNAVLSSLKPSDELKAIFKPVERQILRVALIDSESEIPVLRSATFAAVESLLPYATPGSFHPFLINAISQTEGDWRLFETDSKAAAFCMSAKCRFYSKYITSSTDLSHECRAMLDDGLIIRLSYAPFWNDCALMISSSSSEMKTKTASDILSLFALISTAFNESEDLRIQIRRFFRDYHKVIAASLDHNGHLTIGIIEFYASFSKLLSTIPVVEDLDEVGIWSRIPFIFRRFANEDDWRAALQKDSQDVFKKAKKIISQLLVSLIFVMVKMSEIKNIFTAPLFGEEWRARYIVHKKENMLPLSIITSYLIRLLKDIKENDNRMKSVTSACLVLIWWHIDRWDTSKGVGNIDLGVVRRQASMFAQEPFTKFVGNSNLDNLILRKLIQFSNA
ncbi:hypothetical protein TRFO_10835 [Tritrichomonas foetus]|uniref:Uncharacterized protein n=1 Tax=Tritrichomonas foetus TaxID=1144522 RepID=A0A1J4JCA5_9EUKA|nr:hypothetical protein TRFO_10835 [Tritrichomonas foetus]|eukprot:OHS94892.1 hypothetical protein TRFO_10835 [Tritrichomonas foetus]